MAAKFWNIYVRIDNINKVKTSDRFGGMIGNIYSQWSSSCSSITPPFFFFSTLAHLQLLFLVSEMVHLSPNPPEAWMTQISPSQTTNPKKPRPHFTIHLVTFLPFPQSTYSYQKAACLCICSLVLWPHLDVCSVRAKTWPILLPAVSPALTTCVEYNRCSINICWMN